VAKRGPARQGGPPVQRLELAGVRRSVLVGLGVAILVPVAIVAWIIWGVGGSKSPSGTAGVTHGHRGTALAQRTSAHTENPIMKAVDGINVSMTAKGMLPPSTCKVMSSTMVSCTNPTPAIDTVTFQTFSTLDDLYSAYVKRVSQLAQAPSTPTSVTAPRRAPTERRAGITTSSIRVHIRSVTSPQGT
jgi:hypothetical protein